jgi:hypothetical protein
MKAFKVIMSVFLVVTLLVSSVGFSVSRHYCLGMLAEESFYHLGNESCGMIDECDASGNHLSTHCCDDENLAIPGIQVQERSNEDSGFPVSETDASLVNKAHGFDSLERLNRTSSTLAHAPPDQGSPQRS